MNPINATKPAKEPRSLNARMAVVMERYKDILAEEKGVTKPYLKDKARAWLTAYTTPAPYTTKDIPQPFNDLSTGDSYMRWPKWGLPAMAAFTSFTGGVFAIGRLALVGFSWAGAAAAAAIFAIGPTIGVVLSHWLRNKFVSGMEAVGDQVRELSADFKIPKNPGQ